MVGGLFYARMPAHGLDEWMYVDGWCCSRRYSKVQIGMMLVGASGTGSIYVDDFYAHVPLTQTGLFVKYGDIAAVAIEDSVNMMSIEWDVWSYDGFELTPSESVPRMLHLNISEELVGVGSGIALQRSLHYTTTIQTHLIQLQHTYDIASNRRDS